MKRLLFLTAILITACGPSPEESAKIATLSCNVMGASRNMDSSLRLVEINRARDELGKSAFLQTDDAIKEAFEYGLCHSLVLDSPNYSTLLSEAKAERREQERLAEEAEKARQRAKVLRGKESTLKWRESVDRYFSEFATFRPKLLATQIYDTGSYVKLKIGLTCRVNTKSSKTAGHHFGVDNIFKGLKVSANIHFKDGTVISDQLKTHYCPTDDENSVQPFSVGWMELERREWPDIIMDLAEESGWVSIDTLIEKIDLLIFDVKVHNKVNWSEVTKAVPSFSRSQAREFEKKLDRTNVDIYGLDYEYSYDWKMDNPYIWPLEIQKTITATLVKTGPYGNECFYDTPAGPVRLMGAHEFGFSRGLVGMIEACKKTFEILVE